MIILEEGVAESTTSLKRVDACTWDGRGGGEGRDEEGGFFVVGSNIRIWEKAYRVFDEEKGWGF